jgi:hypothetical protein
MGQPEVTGGFRLAAGIASAGQRLRGTPREPGSTDTRAPIRAGSPPGRPAARTPAGSLPKRKRRPRAPFPSTS